ncbi:D-alanine--D-alanine ligase [Campylobacter sp. 9BO]|uniref:D-alanine--D-alanine ligase n=1 Tax=Campylobacter sp. 9BO TaxID=3424759 RepID=UPI003D33684B
MKKFGVIFGAKSYEHEISIVSAIVLKNVLKAPLKFIFCSADRNFYLIDPKDMRANFFSSGEYKKCKNLILSNGGFSIQSLFGAKFLDVDVYINLVHGMDGEDGKMAALLDFFSVSYIGPRLEASVMSYSKSLTKLLAQKAGVRTLEYEVIRRGDSIKSAYPVILKPSHLGSSIGISIVKDDAELEYALDVGFEFDDEILVEPFVSAIREFNIAGCKVGGKFIFSMIEEPKKKEYLDYEQKYMSFSNETKITEAEISDKLEKNLKEAFKKIYSQGFDGALIRCDFFAFNEEVYLNEINPNPGSLANYLFEDFTAVIEALADSLVKERDIKVDYKFINSITHSKGGKI